MSWISGGTRSQESCACNSDLLNPDGIFQWLAGNHGSYLNVLLLIALGAFEFAGIGLLIVSRAKTLEAVSGLMNLSMVPMWIGSGIFFSAKRFPAFAQPLIELLPLTPLIAALRHVMQEGASVLQILPELGLITLWGAVTFVVAIRAFRWE